MDFKHQLSGLNKFLAAIFGAETNLSTLLANLGFEQAQISRLQDHLEPIVSQFIEAIHKRLTSESGKDTWFQLLSRQYGLDGELPESLDALAGRFGYSPEYARQAAEDALQKCRYKTSQEELKKSLRYIAIGQLALVAGPPPREHITEKLERLTNLRAAADLTRMDYEAKRLEILKQIQAELDALEAEYTPLLESANENLASLEAEIKNDVLMHGESVQAGSYRAVYVQGRVSWDNDGMNRYAVSHPDILQFRKQGQPTVTIRTVEEKKKK
ncbi:MAG: hypothetical protein AB1531_08850 [Chloroflexota bacterium]